VLFVEFPVDLCADRKPWWDSQLFFKGLHKCFVALDVP
jgi:hypothetical protein